MRHSSAPGLIGPGASLSGAPIHCASSLIALVAVLVAGLGTVRPPAAAARAGRDEPEGRDHRRRHPRRDRDATAPTRTRSTPRPVKYTTNVVKVYSPNATWTKVKSAVNGASIVVYLGHGNGWPSPYTYDPNYTTKDGFGLNYDVNGDGKLTDYENKYYGEPSIRTLSPAPNAVVLLFHLCYASGNSEPGNADPSLSTAKQRVDNYAAAFLKAGARAVIANGHSHADYYIDALFTTRQTIDDYWRNAPDFHDNVATYASTRTPGLHVPMDPEGAGQATTARSPGKHDPHDAGRHRAPPTPTPRATPRRWSSRATPARRPTARRSTARAEAAVAGASPSRTLGTTDKVRVDAQEPAPSTADGIARSTAIHTDDGVEGWMTGHRASRPATAPRRGSGRSTTGPARSRPTATARRTTLRPSASSSPRPSTWTLRIVDGERRHAREAGGRHRRPAVADLGARRPARHDGTYRWALEATDAWGNGPLEADGAIDGRHPRPDARGLTRGVAADPAVSRRTATVPRTRSGSRSRERAGQRRRDGPGRGGRRRSTRVSVAVGERGRDADLGRQGASGYVRRTARYAHRVRGAGSRRATRATPQVAGRSTSTGRSASYDLEGRVLPAGRRQACATDDALVQLASPATVDWTIQNAAGAVVRTLRTGEALAAGHVRRSPGTAATMPARSSRAAPTARSSPPRDGTVVRHAARVGRRGRVQRSTVVGHDPRAQAADHRHGHQRREPGHRAAAPGLPARHRGLERRR